MGSEVNRCCQVLDVDYEKTDSGTRINVYCIDQKGDRLKFIDESSNPYFIAVPSEEVTAQDLIDMIEGREFECDSERIAAKNVEKVGRKLDRELVECVRVELAFTGQVSKLRREIQDLKEVSDTRNHDISFYRKWMINNDIYPVSSYKFIGSQIREGSTEVEEFSLEDIESIGAQPQSYNHISFDIEVVREEVVMVSFYGEDIKKVLSTKPINKEFVEHCESEEKLIERFVEIFQSHKPDIVTGYNSDEYDFHKLRERSNHHNIELSVGVAGERMKFNRRGRFSSARVKGICHLDMYPYVDHVMSPGLNTNTLDLGSVSEELVGVTKNDMSWQEMKESWNRNEDVERFAEYALKDAEVTWKLGEEIYPQIFELSKLTGLIPFDCCRLTYGQLAENYLIRESMKEKSLVPRRPFRSEQEERRRLSDVEGGFVYQPEPGLYNDIAVLDFKSLYPTVMVSHNISPDTLNVENCENYNRIDELDMKFCEDYQGFFPRLIERLVSERSEIKKKMKNMDGDKAEYQNLFNRQQAQKILANAFYGYLAYTGARWYSEECASATTYLGRKYIQDSIETAEDYGFQIVYGDTDSVMLQHDSLREQIEGYLEEVNESLPEFMELENEGYFVSGFFTSIGDDERGAKKKYALMDKEGNLKITGFEQVRRDWAPVAKRTQKNVLRKVLEGDPDEAASHVKSVVSDIKQGEYPVEDLKIHSTLTKEPEEYDAKSPHVEAVKKARDRGDEISPESTVAYVITPRGSSISEKAELVKYSENYDSEYYINNQIIPAAYRVLKVFGYTQSQLKGEGKQTGLGSFN